MQTFTAIIRGLIRPALLSDEKAKKSTYTSLLGVEQAKSQAEDLLKEALSMLQRAELKHDLLEELAQTIVLRTH